MTTSRLPLPDRPNARRLALAVAMVLPSAITWLYFVRLGEAPAGVQQAVYAVGKSIQFALPVVFVGWFLGRPLRRGAPDRRGVGEGLVSGLAVCAAAVGLWWALELFAPGFLDSTGARIGTKIVGLGIDRAPVYALVAVFYSLIHSALEEYYWRWFVYGQLRRFLRARPAVWLGTLAFVAHHVLVIGLFTGGAWSVTLPLALVVGLGGAYWAWLYERSGSLLGPWLSHLLADAAVFALGWQLAARV